MVRPNRGTAARTGEFGEIADLRPSHQDDSVTANRVKVNVPRTVRQSSAAPPPKGAGQTMDAQPQIRSIPSTVSVKQALTMH